MTTVESRPDPGPASAPAPHTWRVDIPGAAREDLTPVKWQLYLALVGLALGALGLQRRLDDAHVERGERCVDGVHQVLAQVGDEAAERVGEAGAGRHQHLGDAQLAGDGHRVQRASAAEGEQHEVARVVAARQ